MCINIQMHIKYNFTPGISIKCIIAYKLNWSKLGKSLCLKVTDFVRTATLEIGHFDIVSWVRLLNVSNPNYRNTIFKKLCLKVQNCEYINQNWILAKLSCRDLNTEVFEVLSLVLVHRRLHKVAIKNISE